MLSKFSSAVCVFADRAAEIADLSVVKIAAIGSTVLTFFVWLIGGWDMAIQVMCVLIVLDSIGGIACAWQERCLSSSIGWKGVRKKSGYFAVVIVANMFDMILGGGQQPFARTITISLLSIVEMLSILENAGRVGVPIPTFLLERVTQLREQLGGITTITKGGKKANG